MNTCMRPHRLQSFEYSGGHRYFVTYCTDKRRVLFTSEPLVRHLAWQILQSCERYQFAVLAYVFMPDHCHLLVEGHREDADFRALMANCRKRTSLAARPCVVGRLWQDGYHERVLRREEATETVIEYILANPIRAGLVENAMDYPFSWSVSTHSATLAAP